MKTVYCKFVEFIPDELEAGVLYVSQEYKTAIHLCPCGCGNQVVTPLSPTEWELKFKNGLVSLYPSIGNWSLNCKSHYWIKNNEILWAKQFPEYKISEIREFERREKKMYYKKRKWNRYKGILNNLFDFLFK